tara:strand:+ start:4478 stop:5269 length:792 start_codon:yes stop_codon:yes gene_type:complete
MRVSTLTFVSFFIFCCSKEPDQNSVVLARVNSAVLTADDLDLFFSSKQRSDEQLRIFVQDWVNNTVLYQEAKNTGLDKDLSLQRMRDEYYKKLVVGSLLKSAKNSTNQSTNEDIRKYYEENALGFVRTTDEATVHHFVTNNISEARTIKRGLSKKQSGDEVENLFSFYSVETRTIKQGRLVDLLDNLIFKSKKTGVVGPIRVKENYHVIEILNYYRKGTQMGLEEVYDEIYQRLKKRNSVTIKNQLLDSLRKNSNIFINNMYN